MLLSLNARVRYRVVDLVEGAEVLGLQKSKTGRSNGSMATAVGSCRIGLEWNGLNWIALSEPFTFTLSSSRRQLADGG